MSEDENEGIKTINLTAAKNGKKKVKREIKQDEVEGYDVVECPTINDYLPLEHCSEECPHFDSFIGLDNGHGILCKYRKVDENHAEIIVDED